MSWIPYDPALPALPELFPASGVPSAVAQMAQEAAGTATAPETARISHIRYRPTRSCDVLWSFPSQSDEPLLVSVRLLNTGAGAITARSSFQQSAEMVRATLGGRISPYRYLADSQLLLQIFPLDMRLPGLALATSTAWLREAFGRLLGVTRDEVQIVESVPVHYKPWCRCVMRYVVEVHGRRVQYFAKVFRDDRGGPMVERLQLIRRTLLNGSNVACDVVVPVAYFPEACMLVLAAQEASEELSRLLRKAVDDSGAREALREQMARVAEWLLAFQRTVVAGVPRVSPRDILSEHERDLIGILETAPAFGRSIQRWLGTLEATAARLPEEEMVLGHGAFRYNQFLHHNNALVGLDLDAVCLTGISADAGEFLAYLDLSALRRPHLRSIAADCQEVFLAALRQDARVDPRWLAWHRAASHLKWARRKFLCLDPRWPELTEDLSRVAEQTLTDDHLRTSDSGRVGPRPEFMRGELRRTLPC